MLVRIVPSSTAVSGIMLPTVPAWNLPTVNTQECVGSLSLAIILVMQDVHVHQYLLDLYLHEDKPHANPFLLA